MYQNLINEMSDNLRPLQKMFGIQSQTSQALLSQHMTLLSDCLEVGMRQAQTLRQGGDLTSLMRLPLGSLRVMSAKCLDTAGVQWRTLMQARDAMNGIVESSVS